MLNWFSIATLLKMLRLAPGELPGGGCLSGFCLVF